MLNPKERQQLIERRKEIHQQLDALDRDDAIEDTPEADITLLREELERIEQQLDPEWSQKRREAGRSDRD